MAAITLIKTLIDAAKAYRCNAMTSISRNGHMHNATGMPIDQRDIDAMLTDYINFVASRYGIDLALYAVDLESSDDTTSTAG